MSAFQNPIAIECRVNWLTVGGGDTVHEVLARLVSPPTGDNLGLVPSVLPCLAVNCGLF